MAQLPRVVQPDEWPAARKAFLIKEKEFTRARDTLNAALAGSGGAASRPRAGAAR